MEKKNKKKETRLLSENEKLSRKGLETLKDSQNGLEESKTSQGKGPVAELTELLQRTQANLENYRKQTEKRIGEIRQMAAKDLILQILPVMDNFELALQNTCSKQEDFLSGVELIYSQLLTVLKDNGIKPIETENQLFDPFYHEALLKVNSELPENTIVEEVQKGFLLNDKVLRHARVKISTGKKESNNEITENKENQNQDGGQ